MPRSPPPLHWPRSRGLTPFAGLVNAVLRRLSKARPPWPASTARGSTRQHGCGPPGAQARAIALAHQHEAPLDLTLRPGPRCPRAPNPADWLDPLSRRHPGHGARVSRKGGSGCRTPPPHCRPGCWRRGPASAWSICVPHPAARPLSLPPPARRSLPWSATRTRLARLRDNLRRWRLTPKCRPTPPNGRRPRRSTPCCWTRLAAPPERSAATRTCRT